MHYIKKTRTSLDNDIKQFVDNKNVETIMKCEARSPVSTDDSGWTPLHDAVNRNDLEMLQSLLDSECDVNVNVKDLFGSTPLLLAAITDNFNAVKFLLDKGGDVFVTDSSDRSVLEILLGKSSLLPLSIVARLLYSLMNCKLDIASKVEILLKANCDLKLVLYLKNAQITQEYLICKSHITEEELAVGMEFAMDRLDLGNVQVFLHHRSEKIDWTDIFIRKLVDLSMPSERRNLQSAKVFLQILNTWGLIRGDFIDYFCGMFGFGDKDLLELLWQCNIHVLIKQKLEVDLVAHMFENRNVKAYEFLCKSSGRQFDVNAKGEDGSSALHFAIRGDSEKNVRFLLDLGANINVTNERGRTPLLEAVAYDRKRIVRILLQYGADIRAVVHEKFTVFDPFEHSFCPDMQQFFIAQLILNETLGMPILDSVLKRMNRNKICKQIYENCRIQIEEMKKVEIRKSFSLFTPIEGDLEKITCHVRDKKTAQMLEDHYRQRKIHPYYYSLLRLNLVKAFGKKKVNYTMIISDANKKPVVFDESMKENINSGSMNVRSA